MRKAVKDEADRLIMAYNERAYEMARQAMREARRRRNARLERFFVGVALEVAKRQRRVVSDDVATRWRG